MTSKPRKTNDIQHELDRLLENERLEDVKSEALPVKLESLHVKQENSPELTTLAIRPAQPYIDCDSMNFDFFRNITSEMLSRSQSGPRFWQYLVPQAAQQYACVRNAMLALAVSSRSLVEKSSSTPATQASSQLQVITHTGKAVQSLLHEQLPLDVVLLTSATLGALDVFEGRWETASKHVLSGARLARQSMANRVGDYFIAFYCEAFASALPAMLKQAEHSSAFIAPEKHRVVRLNEAVQSLRQGKESFELAIEKTEIHAGPFRESILRSLINTKAETELMLAKWEEQLYQEMERTSPPDDDLKINFHLIESPWSAVMQELNVYLDCGGRFNFEKFEVAMERTLPFYTLAKSGPDIKMREAAAEWMLQSAQKRMTNIRTRTMSTSTSSRISEIDDKG